MSKLWLKNDVKIWAIFSLNHWTILKMSMLLKILCCNSGNGRTIRVYIHNKYLVYGRNFIANCNNLYYILRFIKGYAFPSYKYKRLSFIKVLKVIS